MRSAWIGVVVLLAAGAIPPATAQGSFEPNVDRQGSDYYNFDIRGGPHECQAACARDRQCTAWTFVHRDVQGPSQRCWLKNNIPPPSGDTCCVSGVMR
jgi:hypothetical protein